MVRKLKTKCFHQIWISEKVRTNEGVTQAVQGIFSRTRLILKTYTSYIYIYRYKISHHSAREHRALTKLRHQTRFLASTLTSFHVLPWCLISLRIVLRHVVRGLVPWGFHSRAAFVTSLGGQRSVWPSLPHFLCQISNSTGLALHIYDH